MAENAEKTNNITRRNFLKLVGLATFGPVFDRLLTSMGYQTPLKKVWEEIESGATLERRSTRELISQIESSYSVKIINPEQPILLPIEPQSPIAGLSPEVVRIIVRREEDLRLIGWDKPRLLLVKKVLEMLPSGVYLGQSKDPALCLVDIPPFTEGRIDIKDHIYYKATCVCGSQSGNDPPTIALHKDSVVMTLDQVKHSMSLITHELTHIKELNDPTLTPKVMEELGFDEVTILDLAAKKGHVILTGGDAQTLRETGLVLIRIRDNIGASAYLAGELIPIAAGEYFLGKDNFFSVYGDTFGTEKTEKFYDFLKNNIFEGKEYN